MIGVVVVVVVVIPWIAIPVIPLGVIFFFLRRYFLETSRDVKRLECSSEYWNSQVGMAMQVGCIYTIINHTPENLQNISFLKKFLPKSALLLLLLSRFSCVRLFATP